MRSPSPSSTRFDVEFMPLSIHRRQQVQYSVHYSPMTFKWIATIARHFGRRSTMQYSFSNEREARKFAKAYAPPRPMQSSRCATCEASSRRHCKNCGACVCDACSRKWGIRMIPKTFVPNNNQSLTVQVCCTCDWLSNAFCMALLQGKWDDAKRIVETGNVNLRTSFADINGEAMFPVHCAVMGGNLMILKWLVETHACPIAVKRDKGGRVVSVQTSAGRTMLDLAMSTGTPKMSILKYLVTEQNMSVTDTKDPGLVPRTLEALLKADTMLVEPHVISVSEESVATMEDACILCCEKAMDCVLVPCGHQVCCEECGRHLSACPVCKAGCTVLRIFRQ